MKTKAHLGATSELRACVYLLERGYEVFRNVSPCGAIDLIGVKDEKVYYFDVKTVGMKVSGEPNRPRLKHEQHRIGVKLLVVLPDGTVRDDVAPTQIQQMSCEKCGGTFVRKKAIQRFCSRDCQAGYYRDFGMPKSARADA